MTFYFMSSFLDAFDGMAARYFDQSSTFGGMLDMLTDRVGTMALIMSRKGTHVTCTSSSPRTALSQYPSKHPGGRAG